jgi:hypothetical protein
MMELLGPTELAARSVPFVCMIATALMLAVFAARHFGREAAWLAGIAALAAPLPVAFARIVILDGLLAMLVTASLLSFFTAVEARVSGRCDRWWTVAAWFAIGLGILTKGPVAMAIPIIVAAPYAIWRRASWAVWNPLGPLTAAAVVTPWVWFMEDRLPGYLEYVAVTETWRRLTSDELQRTQPWWYFLAVGGAGFLPWWPLVLGRSHIERSREHLRAFAWLWLLVPLIFFSISTSKLPQYILPLMPAVALLVATQWDPKRGFPKTGTRIALLAWGIFALLLIAVGFGALDRTATAPEILAVVRTPTLLLAAVCIIAIGWAVVSLRTRRWFQLAASLSLPVIAMPVVLQPVIAATTERRSERALAELIRTELPTETEVIGYRAWRPSLAFYLRRPIPIVSRDGDELRSNYIVRTHDRWIDPEGTLRRIPADIATVSECDRPQVVLVHALDDEEQRTMEAAGLERIWEGQKLHAFFCSPSTSID